MNINGVYRAGTKISIEFPKEVLLLYTIVYVVRETRFYNFLFLIYFHNKLYIKLNFT